MLPRDCRVLLMGANEHTEMLRAFLTKHELDVILVNQTEDARSALGVVDFDVILVDCNEADVHGREIVNRIETARVPIITLTHYAASLPVRRQLSSVGVIWVVQKPVVVPSLPKLILHTASKRETFSRAFSSKYVPMCETASAMLEGI